MTGPARSVGTLSERASSPDAARRMRVLSPYIHAEIAGGVMLLIGTALGLLAANSWFAGSYAALLHTELSVDLGIIAVTENVQHAVNDGLMTLFFFVVGLEIKRELIHGELSRLRKATLPLAAAFGGMALPALIYLAFNPAGPAARGWGVPVATDIAFAIGVLTMLGDRVPRELKIFLLAFAAADDVGGILIIAVFYAKSLSVVALAVGAALVGCVVLMRRSGVQSVGLYSVVGVLVWLAMLKSGVHATIAGVALGLITPARARRPRDTYAEAATALIERFIAARAIREEAEAEMLLGQLEERTRATEEPLDRLDRRLRPWVSYVVLPVFAFTNAGVELSASSLATAVRSPITHGIVVALLAGNLAGVSGFTWLTVKLRLAELPTNVRWSHVVGVALLAGMGYTVALFIAGLSFTEPAESSASRVGILAASVIAGCAGFLWLRFVRVGGGKADREPSEGSREGGDAGASAKA